MEPYGFEHLMIAIWAGMVGTLSLVQALGIWRVRNGGLFTRAVVGQLAAFGVWTYFILGEALYQWHLGILVSHLSQIAADADRLILTIPQAIILIGVIPKATKKDY